MALPKTKQARLEFLRERRASDSAEIDALVAEDEVNESKKAAKLAKLEAELAALRGE